MKRMYFLASAGAIGTVLSVAAVANGANWTNPVSSSPVSSPSPNPAGSPFPRHRGERPSYADLKRAERMIARLIERLQGDQTDYAGHKSAAIADLQRAQSEIVAAIQYDQAHPNSPNTNSGLTPNLPTTNQL